MSRQRAFGNTSSPTIRDPVSWPEPLIAHFQKCAISGATHIQLGSRPCTDLVRPAAEATAWLRRTGLPLAMTKGQQAVPGSVAAAGTVTSRNRQRPLSVPAGDRCGGSKTAPSPMGGEGDSFPIPSCGAGGGVGDMPRDRRDRAVASHWYVDGCESEISDTRRGLLLAVLDLARPRIPSGLARQEGAFTAIPGHFVYLATCRAVGAGPARGLGRASTGDHEHDPRC